MQVKLLQKEKKKMKNLLIVLLFFVVVTVTTAQENNPDRYIGITIGAGVHGTHQIFSLDGTEYRPEYHPDKMVDVPMVYSSIIIPATDYLSVIFSGYYQPDYSSRWDDAGVSPTNFVHKEYSYSAALKFYIR